MSDTGWRKLGAAAGVGFVALVVLSYILGATDAPGFNEGAGATAAYVAEEKNAIDAAAGLLAGALVLFAIFLGAVSANSRRVDRDGRGTAAGHAGGIAALSLALVGVALTAGASAASGNGSDPGVVSALFQTGALTFACASLGVAVFIGATSIIAMRFGALPSLLGIAGLVLAVATAAVAIISLTTRDGAFNPYDGVLPLILLGLFGVWVLATAASLWGRAGLRR